MCGIAGVLALGGRPPERAWGEAMLAAIRHRGPDGEGIFADHRIVLAHARLAIIDTSSGGAQPMRSADGRFAIVQNGEVYNHHELRRTLEAEGATFRTRSDTEVLVELLARRGPSALDDVRGMFAFALYDSATGDLVLARDRLGKKPLVWVRTDEYLAFASEARALLRLPFVRARLDRTRAREFVRFLYVPSPHTALEGVRKLPAAHLLTVRGAAPGVHPEPERWWRLPAPDPAQRADAAWFERLDAELLEATRLRTVSDVPIGVFLSGGVDSTTVLERLHAAGHRPIRTFTVGFRGLPDERAIARASAARYGAEHVELVLEPDLEHDIDAILEHFGDFGPSFGQAPFLLGRREHHGDQLQKQFDHLLVGLVLPFCDFLFNPVNQSAQFIINILSVLPGIRLLRRCRLRGVRVVRRFGGTVRLRGGLRRFRFLLLLRLFNLACRC